MSPIRDQQIGILEIASYLTAAVAVVGTILWGWNLNLIVSVIILVVAYAVLRDVRSLWLLKWRDERLQSPAHTILFRRSSSCLQARRPLTVTDGRAVAGTESIAGVDQNTPVAQEKGTTHESKRLVKV